jgi:hypothetical protein
MILVHHGGGRVALFLWPRLHGCGVRCHRSSSSSHIVGWIYEVT